MTIIVTIITHRSSSAVYIVGPVTPNMDRIKEEAVLTSIVLTLASLTVPVFTTVVWIWVPSIRHAGAVHWVVAGNSGRLAFTVLITDIAYWTVSTFYRLRKVAPHIYRVVQEVVLAHDVLPVTSITVPVLAAIVGICVVTISQTCTVLVVAAINWRWSVGDTVSVTIITNRPLTTVYILWIVTPLSFRFKQQAILANFVLRVRITQTGPVLAAVVGIRIVPLTKFTTVSLPRVATVLRSCYCCGSDAVLSIAAGSITTLYICWIEAPI